MKKFIIEHELPKAGKLSAFELKAFATRSCNAIENLDKPYHWIQSFVTDNKLYSIHVAPDRETVFEQSRQIGFPSNKIYEVNSIIDPTTSAIHIEKAPRRVFE